MSSLLIDIWPEGVGYDTFSGYRVEYYDAKKDPIQRICLLVDSWKKTALVHGFNCEGVQRLSCLQYANGHRLTFSDALSNERVLNCQLQTMQVDADVDEEPCDTCVQIEICGKNFDTGNDFKYSLTVYRRPNVHSITNFT